VSRSSPSRSWCEARRVFQYQQIGSAMMTSTATITALRGFVITLLAMLASNTPARSAGGASLPSSAVTDASDLNAHSTDMIASSIRAAASSLVACPASVYETSGEARNRHIRFIF
jgi:hypothetical protein